MPSEVAHLPCCTTMNNVGGAITGQVNPDAQRGESNSSGFKSEALTSGVYALTASPPLSPLYAHIQACSMMGPI